MDCLPGKPRGRHPPAAARVPTASELEARDEPPPQRSPTAIPSVTHPAATSPARRQRTVTIGPRPGASNYACRLRRDDLVFAVRRWCAQIDRLWSAGARALGPISPPKASPSGHLPEPRPRQQCRSRPATSTMSKEPVQRADSDYGIVRSFVSVWLVLPGDGLLAGNAAAGGAGEARQADDLPVDQRSELGEAVHQWMLTAGPERQDVA